MKRYILIPFLLLFLCLQQTFAKVEIVSSLTDLASIAVAVGGGNVNVLSIARSTADPHSVEVLPSYMVRVSRADIYIRAGLGFDQWADGIIDGSRNAKLHIVDCSERVRILEKQTTKVTALQGDVHPYGNPHYWLDPANGKMIAEQIHDELISIDPDHREEYTANLTSFLIRVDEKVVEWSAIAEELPSREIITYHESWPYFADAFGFKIVTHVEPVPGIPPSASHLSYLLDIIRGHNILALIQEPYFSDDAPAYLAREAQVRVVKLSPSCENTGANSYLKHFDQIFTVLRGNEQ